MYDQDVLNFILKKEVCLSAQHVPSDTNFSPISPTYGTQLLYSEISKSLQQESQPLTQGDTIHDDDADQVNNIIAYKIIHDKGPSKISVWAQTR